MHPFKKSNFSAEFANVAAPHPVKSSVASSKWPGYRERDAYIVVFFPWLSYQLLAGYLPADRPGYSLWRI